MTKGKKQAAERKGKSLPLRPYSGRSKKIEAGRNKSRRTERAGAEVRRGMETEGKTERKIEEKAKGKTEEILREIQARLFELQDTEYRDFHAGLMPTVDKEKVIGVRTPVLRKYARELSGQPEAQEFLKALPHIYYEENNLHGFLLEKIKDYDTCMGEMKKFLPYIDNWATCDGVAPKVFGRHKEELIKEIPGWLESGQTYVIRFGVNMLMRFFLDEDFKPEYAEKVAAIRSEEYYVKMVVAWYFATALAKQYDAVIPFLEERCLENWTHQKTIQKARESYRISPAQKEYLKTLK